MACGGGVSTPNASFPDSNIKVNNVPIVLISAIGLQTRAGALSNTSLSITLSGAVSLDGWSSKDPDGVLEIMSGQLSANQRPAQL